MVNSNKLTLFILSKNFCQWCWF